VVGRDDHAAAIHDAIFSEVLFVDAQDIGRRSAIDLHRLIELIPVDVSQVARLTHAQDYALHKPVEAPEHGFRRHFLAIPAHRHAAHDAERRCAAQ
jgi:hypothetical protein